MESANKSKKIPNSLIVLGVTLFLISVASFFDLFQVNIEVRAQSFLYDWIKDILYLSKQQPVKSLKLGTFYLPTPTITPTRVPVLLQQGTTPYPTISGVQSGGFAKQYCVDEAPGTVTIESCDDDTRCDIAHGAGGPSGRCGTVISWEHKIIETLLGNSGKGPYYNELSKDLTTPIQSSCYTANPYSPYISTFNIIDSYNLAGFHEFSRGTHTTVVAIANTWRTTAGYTISTSANSLTPGDVVFFNNPPHVGLVNTVEIDSRGNGDIWFLHTAATYYLGKLIVANWTVVASSTGDNNVIFGSHQSKVADDTRGETVCYCGGGNICYRWPFKPI